MLISIISDVAKEANKQIIILANIYQKLGNYFYKSSKHWFVFYFIFKKWLKIFGIGNYFVREGRIQLEKILSF